MPLPDLLTKQQTLCQRYFQLTDMQRSLMQVFALLYQPVGRVKAWKFWKLVILQKSNQTNIKPLTSQQFGYQVTKLVNQGLLSQELGEGPCCSDLLIDVVVRDAVNVGTFEPIAQGISQQFPIRKRYGNSGPREFSQEAEFMRELRIAIYREDFKAIDALYEDLRRAYWKPTRDFSLVLRDILNNPFDRTWFDSLSHEFRQLGLRLTLEASVRWCLPAEEAFELLETLYHEDQTNAELRLLYAEQLWLRGHLGEVSTLLANSSNGRRGGKLDALRGAIAFLTESSPESAINYYHQALKAAGKSQTAQVTWFNSPATLLFFFALLKDGTPTALKEAEQYCTLLQQQSKHWLKACLSPLWAVIKTQQGQLNKVLEVTERFSNYTVSKPGLAALIEIYSLYWLSAEDLDRWLVPQLIQRYRIAAQVGYGWIALEIAELLTRLEAGEIYGELAEALRESTDSQPLIDVVQRQEPWELSLKALTNLTTLSSNNVTSSKPTFRIAWKLRFSSLSNWELTPLEQKFSVRGGWTKGKPIALKRLRSGHDMPPYLTDEDRRICDTLEVEYESSSHYYRSSKPSYYFNQEAFLALVGHPRVFWADTENIRVDVVKGEPELFVKRLTGDRLRLELSQPIQSHSTLLVFKETPTRLKVIAVNDEHRSIAELLGPKNQLEVPAQAQEQVLQAIAAVSSLVTVQSDIGGGVAVEEVPADATPRVHLLPAGEGLKVSLLIHPFPNGGSYYAPGQGGATVIAEVEGKRLQTQRNLQLEKERTQEIKTTCSVLEQYEIEEDGEWLIEAPSDCLELLLQLQMMGDRAVVEWPEGEKFRVSRQLGLSDFKLKIRRQKDWFAASGEVHISEDQILDIQHLMALLEASPGKFVELSDGQFLALTDEFRKRLQTLNRLSESNGKGLRIHGLAALTLDEMVEDVEQLKVDKAWKAHIQHIKAARTIEPQIPTTLQATLRDYQQEGYTWLARLAHWGVGACLADDMGLGKTLQAIAVILHRCSEGPTLVIAPTSVCLNWMSETERFAPSLQVKVFGNGDRQRMLDNLGAKDLLICSYGLLQQEEAAAMLAKILWQTIVLDEAQAIKNSETKRSQAAMALQGNFKVITTGTPIENHLGELWNLFRFINPGLLGSLDSFNDRFAYPIERDQNDAAREALRRLIRPFILRRTKNQVLRELPSRTEITLQVELSTEEMAFYEALRREAVQKLSESEASAGQKHLQVLAEIMQLRRACCHPRLVRPELALSSSKLTQFGQVLAELLDNDHKALVFSQFVDHLTVLREYLDKQQISYQYLDGSTPAKQRKTRVEAFQQGEGDVFLISLKAGGTGLNLTAADYVIHMDPWWNPAVEDQASDRAHRIGQQRPVTIYRLVAKGTIEDKIVELHQAKRDLADSLLTGSDVSGKISTEVLLSLLQEDGPA